MLFPFGAFLFGDPEPSSITFSLGSFSLGWGCSSLLVPLVALSLALLLGGCDSARMADSTFEGICPGITCNLAGIALVVLWAIRRALGIRP